MESSFNLENIPTAVLKNKRDDPVRGGHPWIFSKALEKTPESPPGSLVKVLDSRGKFVGLGSFHPGNSIRIRIFTRKPEVVDLSFFSRKIGDLYNLKKELLPPDTDGFRIVHGDADSLPGLIADIYNDTLVFQIHTSGMERFRPEIIKTLSELFMPKAVIERSDIESRREDGLLPLPAVIHYGNLEGPVTFHEQGISFLADPLTGQKTGFFLDQREARSLVRQYAGGRKVLNLFSYTGAFTVAAACGGASRVVSVDLSKPALAWIDQTLSLNGISPAEERFPKVCEDVFSFLSQGGSSGRDFDLMICDPPAFAKKSAHKMEAAKAYIRLNRLCLSGLKPGSIFFTSSCSGVFSMEEFQDLLRIAAGQARREVVLLKTLTQPFDHTSSAGFPEGRYLKTAVCLLRDVLPD